MFAGGSRTAKHPVAVRLRREAAVLRQADLRQRR
jgi:hypothetical protein